MSDLNKGNHKDRFLHLTSQIIFTGCIISVMFALIRCDYKMMRKHIQLFFGCKNENFSNSFFIFAQNVIHGTVLTMPQYKLEPPCPGGSNEYLTNLCFRAKARKIGIPLYGNQGFTI